MRDDAVKNSDILLEWYDAHARIMPWRVAPAARLRGVRPNPYHVWLSEVMLQQTTVAAVNAYFEKFVSTWPRVEDLAAAEDADVMAAWAGLGYYARARNLLKCARVVADELGGVFPAKYDDLIKLPGIGPYTAAAISAIAFDQPSTVLDGNVERVMARFHAIHTPLPTAKPELYNLAEAETPDMRPGDYAQAVMDLGATICTPRNPACGICPWVTDCAARAQGIAADLPKKLPKQAKPIRKGTVFVAIREDGAVLLEKRPDKGLLGGMLGWPGNEWAVEPAGADAPMEADWVTLNEEVRHTFTHFHLYLTVKRAVVTQDQASSTGTFVVDFDPSALPTVMRKVWKLVEKSNER